MDGFSTVLQMVESGLCHSFMPISSVSRQVEEGRIEARRIKPGNAQRQLILGQTPTKPHGRASAAVTDIIIREIKELVETGVMKARLCSDITPSRTSKQAALRD